jgi:hypothetical protein
VDDPVGIDPEQVASRVWSSQAARSAPLSAWSTGPPRYAEVNKAPAWSKVGVRVLERRRHGQRRAAALQARAVDALLERAEADSLALL